MSIKIQETYDQIDLLQSEIDNLLDPILDKINKIEEQKIRLKVELDEKIKAQAQSKLFGKDYNCGTVTIRDGAYEAKVVVSKKVEWDQSALSSIREQIISAGKNPGDYIKEKLSVSETAYRAFPEPIQRTFQSARTVTPGKPTIKIERKAQ